MIKCPKCKAGGLGLTFVEERIFKRELDQLSTGDLISGTGYDIPGEVVRVDANCDKCGHSWRMKRETFLNAAKY
jgi:Zn finger protein HypA/HybF involved in hydrogenase expression